MKLSPIIRTRILLIVIFLFPIAVMIFFWLFGNSPDDLTKPAPH